MSERRALFNVAGMDGKIKSIGSDRALVLDLVRLAQKVPSFPVERWFEMGEVAEAREAVPRRISWVTLFAKAYALACRDTPELRRAYISFPWPRYFQSRYCVISVAVNRQLGDQERLFFGRLRWPEDKSLPEIQQELDGYVHGDVRKMFRHQLRCSRVPRLLRRLGWWWRTNFVPSQRARRIGTGGMSVLASQGVRNGLHPCMLTSSISYDALQDGRMWVTLQCDHRIVDGAVAARAINAMHDYMRTDILAELQSLSSDPFQPGRSLGKRVANYGVDRTPPKEPRLVSGGGAMLPRSNETSGGKPK